jgi:hypothetical protein
LRCEDIYKRIAACLEVRILRVLRRETGRELEIKFDPKQKMGFVMDELSTQVQQSQGGHVNPMISMSGSYNFQTKGGKKQSTVECSARIKKFTCPIDYQMTTQQQQQAQFQDCTNPLVRQAVIAVFHAREVLAPLSLHKCAAEAGKREI